MVHKTSSTPTSGADAAGIYGADYNKLVNHLTRATAITDPFTFNFDEHTFKDSTTNALGDLLMNNGTKFGRRAKGSALQYLRVNSGGTDLEWATLGAGGDVTGAANVGSGGGQVFRDEVAGVLNLKTLLAGTNISLTNNANDVTISATGGAGGEANLGANVGTGTGTLFRDKTSVTLNFKTLLAGSGITITNNANDITLASTGGGGGEINTASNVNLTGTGPSIGIFKQKTAVNLEFRGIDVVSTSRLSVALDATNNTIDLDIPNGAISNAEVSASAAIAKSKLANLDIVNADVNASAAIAKTKLANLDIVNADVNASAAIAKTKLAALNITNSDLSGSAGITDANLAQITNKAKLHSSIVYYDSESDYFQVSQRNQKFGEFTLSTATGGGGIFTNGFLASFGTFSRQQASNSGLRARFATATTLDAQAGLNTIDVFTRRSNLQSIWFRIAQQSPVANVQLFVGLISGSITVPTSTDPLNARHGIGVWVDAASSTNYQIARNDGAGATVIGAFTTPRTADTTTSFQIYCDNSVPNWTIEQEGVAQTFTTDVPDDSVLWLVAYVQTKSAGTAKQVDIRHLEFRGNAA